MAVKPKSSARAKAQAIIIAKEILLFVAIIMAAIVFYLVAYYFCLYLLEKGYISATVDSPRKVTIVISGESFVDRVSSLNKIQELIAPDVAEVLMEPESSSQSSEAALASTSEETIRSDNGIAPNIADPSLVFGSHFDTFANASYINSKDTTLYHDKLAAAYFFAPDYVFGPAEDNINTDDKDILNSVSLSPFKQMNSDRRCLGNDCLEQTGKQLSFRGHELALPVELNSRDIAAVSIGALTKRWLIGVTVNNAGKYEGLIYSFDGQSFSRVLTPEPIISAYYGVFGFGGGENNYLAIYGAYKGIAYHFQGAKVNNVSNFFDFRVMDGGFKPEVLFTAFETNIVWYVYSSTTYKPMLIKLWQNRGEEIAGELVYNIFSRGDDSAVFKLSRAEYDGITLLAKIKKNNQDFWYYLRDQGFKNKAGGQLVTAPLAHDGYSSQITITNIEEARFGIDAMSATKADFFFSINNQDWLKLGQKKRVKVEIAPTRSYFLKVVLPQSEDRFYSPFISEISFNYYCRK